MAVSVMLVGPGATGSVMVPLGIVRDIEMVSAIYTLFERYRSGVRWPLYLGITFLGLSGGVPAIADEAGMHFAQDASGGIVTPAKDSCYRFSAPNGFTKPTSGVWADTGIVFADVYESALLTVDSASGTMVSVLREFRTTPTLKGKSMDSQLMDLSVIRALPDGSGYVVEDEGDRQAYSGGDRLYRLNNEMEIVALPLAIEGRLLEGGWTLDVIYDWQPAIVDGILGVLAFADFEKDGEWGSGLVYFDESDDAGRIFQTLPVVSDAGYQHTQEGGYLAVIGQTGFMLVYEEQPYLLRVNLNSALERAVARLEISKDFRHRPTVKKHPDWQKADRRGPEQSSVYFEVIERSSGVAGIFSRGEQLFMIGRNLSGNWILSEVSSDGEEIARSPMPISGESLHVTFAVGLEHIALLGKHSVERIGPGRWNEPFLRPNEIVVWPSNWLDDLRDGQLSASTAECF